MIKPLRVVLDVNVFVRLVKARSEGRTGTAAQRIFAALGGGVVCGRPAQIVVSHRMLDTMGGVLRSLSVPEETAEQFVAAVLDAMKAGPEELDPHLILGGSPDLTLEDAEDGGVLATAFAARADVIITDNLADFMLAGGEIFRTTIIRPRNGGLRTLTCQVLNCPDRIELVVAHPIDFAMGLSQQFDPTPKMVRERYSASTPVQRL